MATFSTLVMNKYLTCKIGKAKGPALNRPGLMWSFILGRVEGNTTDSTGTVAITQKDQQPHTLLCTYFFACPVQYVF